MSARAASVPPRLDGYEFIGVLGSGGFADVFKYQQLIPRREVAVKVLLRDLGAKAQQQFEHEANLMALLSSHPSIVSIFSAGVAPDGRPFLVMENCQPKHLGLRLRAKPLAIGRALEYGIQVAGAVETAHRLSILHRDIKPANILFTDFGRPALTDFGISVADGGGPAAAAFSVAWAPPEQIDNQPMGPSGDVYSLAGTVWAMLAGHSPFDRPGDNDTLALTSRVKTMPLPPTGRIGVPDSLERVLRTAMAKRPEQRYQSALEFARALQAVQAEMHESVTTIDVRDERADDDESDLTESGTRVTGFAFIDPDVSPGTASGSFDVSDSRGTRRTDLRADSRPSDTSSGSQRVLMHGQGSRPATAPLDLTALPVPQVPSDDTAIAPVPGASTAAEAGRRRPALLPIALGAGAVVVVGGLAAVWALGGMSAATTGGPRATTTARPADPVGTTVPQPTGGQAVVRGSDVVFTWTNPDPKTGDRYLYQLILLDRTDATHTATEPTATVAAQQGKTCVDVKLVRSGGQASEATRMCTP